MCWLLFSQLIVKVCKIVKKFPEPRVMFSNVQFWLNSRILMGSSELFNMHLDVNVKRKKAWDTQTYLHRLPFIQRHGIHRRGAGARPRRSAPVGRGPLLVLLSVRLHGCWGHRGTARQSNTERNTWWKTTRHCSWQTRLLTQPVTLSQYFTEWLRLALTDMISASLIWMNLHWHNWCFLLSSLSWTIFWDVIIILSFTNSW